MFNHCGVCVCEWMGVRACVCVAFCHCGDEIVDQNLTQEHFALSLVTSTF